jgi:septal ring-binding cell division protein DamX
VKRNVAGRRNRTTSQDTVSGTLKGDWRHLTTVAGLLVAVFGTLLLGAVLQVDSQDALPVNENVVMLETMEPMPPGSLDKSSAEEVPPVPEAAAARASVPSDSELSGLSTRVERDLQRLPRSGWMLQIMAACDTENVLRFVEQSKDDERLHLLPATLSGRSCVRICWGPFDSRETAVEATGRLPQWIRALPDSPHPKSVADLQP